MFKEEGSSNYGVAAIQFMDAIRDVDSKERINYALSLLPTNSLKKAKAANLILGEQKNVLLLQLIDKTFDVNLIDMLTKMKQNIIKEESGDQYIIKTKQGIAKYDSNELVKNVVEYIEKNIKDVEINSIVENGDLYTIDLSFELDKTQPQMQYNREYAKSRAYEIKRELESELVTKMNIPTFSIQGIRVVQLKNGITCEFSISMIYGNKNKKQIWESINLSSQPKVADALSYINKASSILLNYAKVERESASEILALVEELTNIFDKVKGIKSSSMLQETLEDLKNSDAILYPKNVTDILETDSEISVLLPEEDKKAIKSIVEKMQADGKIVDEKALYNIILSYLNRQKAN